jgi:plastocyanin
MKKRWMVFLLAIMMTIFASVPVSFAGAAPSASATGPQTYTVVVGAEKAAKGIDLEAFFPDTLMIHVGDTVHWVQNSNEIHTVTFLAGQSAPPLVVPAPAGAGSPLMINPQAGFPAVPPQGLYAGSTYANSGIMGFAPGQAREFNLTFTRAGTYDYICLVHGQMMSAKIIVMDASHKVPSPAEAAGMAHDQMDHLWDQSERVVRDANNSIKPAVKNPDGTMTHYVSMGYSEGQIDLMSFFPQHFVARPGDTVAWTPSASDMAPHTVTFYNGSPDFELVIVKPQPNGPPLLLLNPAVLAPSKLGQPLTRDGVYNSGFIDPTMPGPKSYTLTIGDVSGRIDYDCVLHDASGMNGWITVASRKHS